MHDLVRIAIARELGEGGLESARGAHARHYVAHVEPFEPWIHAATPALLRAAEGLRADASNVRAALDWCAAETPDAGEASGRIESLYRAWRRRSVAIGAARGDASEPAARASDRAGSSVWLTRLYLHLGDLLRLEGRFESAASALAAARVMAEVAGEARLSVRARVTSGLARVQQGRLDAAVEVLRPCLRASREIREPRWESFAQLALGLAFAAAGVTPRSRILLEAALRGAVQHGYPLLATEAKRALGMCWLMLGDTARAHSLASDALRETRCARRVLTSGTREASAHLTLALICLKRSQHALALDHAARGVALASDTGARGPVGVDASLALDDPDALGSLASSVRVRSLHTQAVVHLATREWRRAEPCIDAMLAADEPLEAHAYRIPARRVAARFLARAGRVDEAIRQLESALVARPDGPLDRRRDRSLRIQLASLVSLAGRARAPKR